MRCFSSARSTGRGGTNTLFLTYSHKKKSRIVKLGLVAGVTFSIGPNPTPFIPAKVYSSEQVAKRPEHVAETGGARKERAGERFGQKLGASGDRIRSSRQIFRTKGETMNAGGVEELETTS
ncbi:hypothetical protein TNCV_2065031 [Trichonephila clavipes]|nr:hypothetical protein TNCV_2065031 [Trichonephila clavipes]